jgi:hypothetical protein
MGDASCTWVEEFRNPHYNIWKSNRDGMWDLAHARKTLLETVAEWKEEEGNDGYMFRIRDTLTGYTVHPEDIHVSKTSVVLPTDHDERKKLPVFRGPVMYFPHALLEVARVCQIGNDQHNPGEPMHWARDKSTEQMDTAMRHMMDHGTGNTRDTDGAYHLAKAVWRLMAELQLTVERDSCTQHSSK